MYREPDHAERRDASAAAKADMLARLKHRPAQPAEEIVTWAEREMERVARLRQRPRKSKATYEAQEIREEAVVVVVVEPPPPKIDRPPPVRFSVCVPTVEFVPEISEVTASSVTRSKARMKRWRERQWRLGYRCCEYCGVAMVLPPSKQPKIYIPVPHLVTVDHRHPLSLGGADHAGNFAMCCWKCNNLKGAMTEAEFRVLLGGNL